MDSIPRSFTQETFSDILPNVPETNRNADDKSDQPTGKISAPSSPTGGFVWAAKRLMTVRRFSKELITVKTIFSPKDDQNRQIIRGELIKACGGAAQAFKILDLNGSGSISLQEFVDGLTRLQVRWREITGIKSERKLMSLFDNDRNGVVDLDELFPWESKDDHQEQRMDTPEFLRYWFRRNKYPEKLDRAPMWRMASLDQRLKMHAEANKLDEANTHEKKWIATHYRLLKESKKSDAESRHWIAHNMRHRHAQFHKDADSHKSDVRIRNVAQKAISEPIGNIQREINEMRDQRKTLMNSRQRLWTTVLEPIYQQEEAEQRTRIAAAAVAGLRSRV